jgi:hypothetical protein
MQSCEADLGILGHRSSPVVSASKAVALLLVSRP